MSDHDLQTAAIEIVAKKLGSTPELVQVALTSNTLTQVSEMFYKILNDMEGRLN